MSANGEATAIAAVDRPATPRTIAEDLRALGVTPGDVLMVHTSLSKLGWVAGGPQGVVQGLYDAVGPTGTICMPTQSGSLTDPAEWQHPPVPDDWVAILHDELPAFDPDLTPTRGMGQVVECFRADRATHRSGHPAVSCAARGRHAEAIVANHPLAMSLGDNSPLGRLYELDAKVLLLGVDHGNNTSLHLAESRAEWPSRKMVSTGAPLMVNGKRQWVTYSDLDYDEDDFAQLGEDFAATGAEQTGQVGSGVGRLCRQRAIVDFGITWLEQHRS